MTRAKRIEEAAQAMLARYESQFGGGAMRAGLSSTAREYLAMKSAIALPEDNEAMVADHRAAAEHARAEHAEEQVAELREAVRLLGKEVAAAWRAEGIDFGHGEEIDAHPIASAAVKGKL